MKGNRVLLTKRLVRLLDELHINAQSLSVAIERHKAYICILTSSNKSKTSNCYIRPFINIADEVDISRRYFTDEKPITVKKARLLWAKEQRDTEV